MTGSFEALEKSLSTLLSQLLAHRTAIDALVQSHPEPQKFLKAHRAQLTKLDHLTDDSSTQTLEHALRMHEMYRKHFGAA
jgi:hypothetical protein